MPVKNLVSDKQMKINGRKRDLEEKLLNYFIKIVNNLEEKEGMQHIATKHIELILKYLGK